MDIDLGEVRFLTKEEADLYAEESSLPLLMKF